MSAIGIDFGTTNSVVAVHREGQTEVLEIDQPPVQWQPYGFDKVLPSVMARDENERICFGWEAKQRTTGRFDAVKRMFATQLDVATDDQGESLVVEEVATMLFAELKQRSIAQGVEASKAVVTVPANSKGRARHRTKLAAGMAGFEVLALINEPTAAAMAYAQRHPEARQLLVFDWGGGTLDVTLLQSVDGVFIEQASSGLPRSGGIDFDNKIMEIVREFFPQLASISNEERQRLRLEVELAKVKLSTAEEAIIQLPNGEPFTLTRSRFESAIEGLIKESLQPVAYCLDDLNIGVGSLDALVLVGGTCRIPAIRRSVQEFLKMDADPSINPMTAVGEGAAIAAGIMSGAIGNSDFYVCLEHALGTWTVDPRKEGREFSTIISRGHKLPVRKSSPFFPVDPEYGEVSIEVVEGDPDAKFPDFTTLKEWNVKLHEPYTEGSPRDFTLEYAYDVDGILQVHATDNESGVTILKDDVSYGIATDKRELKQISDRAKAAVSTGSLDAESKVKVSDPEAIKLIEQARVKVIPFLDASEATDIQIALEELENSDGSSQTDSAKVKLKNLLSPFSYLF
jgi:molecular chaperone DnaK (HSP70)